ncbi:MAG: hypothetical protein R3F60_23525 [bacterium]
MGHHKEFTDKPMLDAAVTGKAFKLAAVIGAAGLVATGAGLAMGEKEQFFFSWLTAFMVFTTVSVGALFFVIIHHVARATYSAGLRRAAENVAANLPIMAVLFIPVILGLHTLFHWTHTEAVAEDPILQWKSGYLNETFFLIRAALYFAVWTALIWFFRRTSVAQDASGDPALTFKMRKYAPIGVLAVALSITFAGFDWMMSLDPHWFSTMFGVYTFAGSLVAFYAVQSLMVLWLSKPGRYENNLTIGVRHDAGKLLFAFTIFWAYVTFSQYYLIWYANIPEETAWFQHRLQGGWENVGRLVIIGHFLLPFWVLMSRHMKRNRTVLALGAGWMLTMHFVDLYYVIMPNFHTHGPHYHWMDLTAVLGIGGLWLAFIIRRFQKDAGVAHRDPQLIASMEYDNA